MLSFNLLLDFSLKSVEVDGETKEISNDERKLNGGECDDHYVQGEFVPIKIGLSVVDF